MPELAHNDAANYEGDISDLKTEGAPTQPLSFDFYKDSTKLTYATMKLCLVLAISVVYLAGVK